MSKADELWGETLMCDSEDDQRCVDDLRDYAKELERMIASLTAKLERLRAWLLDLKRRCDEAMSDDNPGDTAGQGDET